MELKEQHNINEFSYIHKQKQTDKQNKEEIKKIVNLENKYINNKLLKFQRQFGSRPGKQINHRGIH